MTIRRNASMRGTIRELEKQVGEPTRQLTVRDWFVGERAEQVARHIEVWALLEFYHHRYVLPNFGVRGVLRRLYLRFFGKKLKGPNGKVLPVELVAILSPWEEFRVKSAIRAAMQDLERCPMAFVEEGAEEPVRCELPTGHEGEHRAGSFSWTDEATAQTPAPPGLIVEA